MLIIQKIMSISTSVEAILENLNKDNNLVNNEVKENTPKRVEDFYTEFFSGMKVDPYKFLESSFPATGSNIVIEKNINFYSMCEHHLLPFFGKISIAYIPNEKLVGFGDIIKMIEAYSGRLQLQERLVEDIATTIYKGLDAKGVYVLIEAEHLCMTMRSVKKIGTKIVTTSAKGEFEVDIHKRAEVLSLLK